MIGCNILVIEVTMKYSIPLLLLLIVGCAKPATGNDQVLFHDDGVAKPKLAVVKVIDSSAHKLEWDLDSEFTEFLLEQLYSGSKFYLTGDFHMLGSNQLKNLELSPYSDDMQWLLEMNSNSEFVLFTEIIDHRMTIPVKTTYNPLTHIKTLHVSLRICVLDIRKDSPKVVLQEIIKKEYPIPFNFGSYKDEGGAIAKNTFAVSPLGLAHKHILSEAAKQIEDYILIAQSNIYD